MSKDLIIMTTEGLLPMVNGDKIENIEEFTKVVCEIREEIENNPKHTATRRLVSAKKKEYRGYLKDTKGIEEKKDMAWQIFSEGIKEMKTAKMVQYFIVAVIPVLADACEEYVAREGVPNINLEITTTCPFCLDEMNLLTSEKYGPVVVENMRAFDYPLIGLKEIECPCCKKSYILTEAEL